VIKVEYSGIDKVLKNLLKEKKAIRNDLRDELRKSAFKTADEVKRFPGFPWITGLLLGSYDAFHSGSMSNEQGNRLQQFQPRSDLDVAAGSPIEYAKFVELGHVKSVGNYVLTHTFERNMQVLLRLLRIKYR